MSGPVDHRGDLGGESNALPQSASGIALLDSIRLDLFSVARREYPYEACGYVLRDDRGFQRLCEIRNIASNREHFFFMDPDHQLEEFSRALSSGFRFFCVFHSHPVSSAYPSSVDIEYMCSDYVHIIISLLDDSVRAFRYETCLSEVGITWLTH